MKTDLELALECIINIYHQYAMKCPIDDYLNETEFSMLLKENAKPFLHNTMPRNMFIDTYIHKLFIRADRNGSGRLKFIEFLTTLIEIVIDAHNRSHQCHRSDEDFCRYLKSSAMSAGLQTTTTCPETRQFPGNCTLEMALNTIVNIYHQYSIRHPHRDLLDFNEFSTLLKEQACTFLQACDRNRPGYLRQLFDESNIYKGRELTFKEFTCVLAKLANDAHHISHNEPRCGPERD
ncbi:PREDICTED: uncharacterized protein LOC104507044 [Eurypyga helias]|uniref:uncharacterized protein LOC104507044 n=1 Tax=Eurypyga helias TaxID=54383 RepID=UPI0005285665|nr:PREDICTED: uncharacterized protein LOC104507044 [Eurypyga helias]